MNQCKVHVYIGLVKSLCQFFSLLFHRHSYDTIGTTAIWSVNIKRVNFKESVWCWTKKTVHNNEASANGHSTVHQF